MGRGTGSQRWVQRVKLGWGACEPRAVDFCCCVLINLAVVFSIPGGSSACCDVCSGQLVAIRNDMIHVTQYALPVQYVWHECVWSCFSCPVGIACIAWWGQQVGAVHNDMVHVTQHALQVRVCGASACGAVCYSR